MFRKLELLKRWGGCMGEYCVYRPLPARRKRQHLVLLPMHAFWIAASIIF